MLIRVLILSSLIASPAFAACEDPVETVTAHLRLVGEMPGYDPTAFVSSIELTVENAQSIVHELAIAQIVEDSGSEQLAVERATEYCERWN